MIHTVDCQTQFTCDSGTSCRNCLCRESGESSLNSQTGLLGDNELSFHFPLSTFKLISFRSVVNTINKGLSFVTSIVLSCYEYMGRVDFTLGILTITYCQPIRNSCTCPHSGSQDIRSDGNTAIQLSFIVGVAAPVFGVHTIDINDTIAKRLVLNSNSFNCSIAYSAGEGEWLV